MKQNTYLRNSKQPNKIHIVKNKEIIIYTNGEESHRYHYSEVSEIPDEESFNAINKIQKKYENFEVENRHTKFNPQKIDFEFESSDEMFQKKRRSDPFLEDEDKTEPQLKEFFQDIENGDWSQGGEGETVRDTEIKKLKKDTKITEEQKVPIQRNNKMPNFNYREENIDIDVDIGEEQSYDESEEIPPQFIVEVESYTSPTFKNVDAKKAENAVLNGINCSQMVNGNERKGIIFLGENQILIFVCFEDKNETRIDLKNIKRIYFNIKGSSNLRNYTIKNSNERFLQFVLMNNLKLDFKFKNDNDLEFLVKGLYVAHKNKSPIINKEIIYQNNKKYFITSSSNKKPDDKNTNSNQKNKYYNSGSKIHHQQHITNESSNSYKYISKNNNNNKNIKYYEEYEEEEENEEEEKKECDCQCENADDGILTTTVTEVFKNGKLINEETKQEYGGRVTKLNSYSPDIKEYHEYLRKSKLKNSEGNLNKYTETENNKFQNTIEHQNH